MPIRKKGDVEIQASANGTKVRQTGYTFYSYDKNAAALYFQFRGQDGQPTDLGKATIHLVMILNDDGGKEFIPKSDEIEVISAIRGTAKYVLPEMLLSYSGKVTGYVYMDFDDGSQSDDGQFTFRIKHSMITHVLPELGDKYVRDFEDVKEQVEQAGDSATKDIEKAKDDAESQIGDYVGEVESAKDSAVEDIDKALLVDEAKKYTDDKVKGFNETITKQLAQTEQRLPRSFKYGELKFPDDFPKKVPFKVYRTREGYTHDFDFTPYEHSKKIYVSRYGSTKSDGLTPETPTRNIDNLLPILSNVEEADVSIVFLDKLFPMSFWAADSISFGKNIRFSSAHEEGTVFGNFAPQSFSTVEDGLFKMTRNAAGRVLLYNVKDVWGNPSEALEVTSLVECQQTTNSFYTDDVDVWVNAPSESLETADENIGVLYRINFPLRFNIESNTMFIDNVKFAREANKSGDYEGLRITGTNQSTVIARHSYFNYGDRNGLETVNVGNVHLFNCQASQNLIDGFNYHGTGDELITEFNCYASDNGDETQGSANATTAHNGMTLLRIGSIGERCFGPVLADVNGCYSYNVGCAMYDSMNPGSFAFFFSETGAETPGAYYLIDCDAENPDGIDVGQNGGSPIKTRNSRFDTATSATEFDYI